MVPTLFIHIHKTAGTSLLQQLADEVGREHICPHPFEWQIRMTPKIELAKYRIYAGHLSASALQFVVGDLQCITMLREPRVRLLSAYFYWKSQSGSQPRHAFYERIAQMSLMDFLTDDDPIIVRATWNVQARIVAGGQFGGMNDHRTNIFGPDLSPAELAVAAVERLGRFRLVGITERYAESVALLFRLFDLDPGRARTLHTLNFREPGVSYSELLGDPMIAAALKHRTEIDTLVYEKACEVLSHQHRRIMLR
jgi:hypothetical protein